MSIADVLPTVRSLTRADQLRLIQMVAQELAENEPASLVEPNQVYPVWSPHDSFEAAATLLRVLDQEKRSP
jgi:hypothetical protein